MSSRFKVEEYLAINLVVFCKQAIFKLEESLSLFIPIPHIVFRTWEYSFILRAWGFDASLFC